jgi:hypothetical protein
MALGLGSEREQAMVRRLAVLLGERMGAAWGGGLGLEMGLETEVESVLERAAAMVLGWAMQREVAWG